jgi:hypothetical protein
MANTDDLIYYQMSLRLQLELGLSLMRFKS